MFIYLPLLICLIGLVLYLISVQPKPAEIGRIMFWVGLLAFLLIGGPMINALQLHR